MSVIWITGAHGFIGRHLALLQSQRGHLVLGLGHGAWPESEARRWGVSLWLNGEISASNLLHLQRANGAPDLIYHLAGGASVGAALRAPREDFGRTVSTTAELLEWIRLESPRASLVAISSAAVYGAGHSGAITEGTPLRPYSPYGYHKLMMEQLCQSYASSFGVASVIPRLFSVYGAGLKKQLLWDLCSELSKARAELELGGSGAELRDWIEVRDVVRALSVVPELASPEAPIVNIGSGVATSVGAIAEQVAALWSGDGARRPRFSGVSRAGDPFSLVADGARLRALGFSWSVPVARGLADYVHWYRRDYVEGAD